MRRWAKAENGTARAGERQVLFDELVAQLQVMAGHEAAPALEVIKHAGPRTDPQALDQAQTPSTR